MFASALRRKHFRADDSANENDNLARSPSSRSPCTAVAERFRRLATWLILVAILAATILAVAVHARVDPDGTVMLDWLLATLLLVSRIWWSRMGHQRIADAFGTVAFVGLGGMACGAVAMLELRLHFPIKDAMLLSWDHGLGIDGLAIVRWQLQAGDWLLALMRPAYNYTLQIFFASLVLVSLLGDRVEAWRAAFCFVGTLITTCLVAMFVPAKGLGVWADPRLFHQLPPHAMRNFWPHFDEFYFGADPVLRLQVVDGVISFPSFHAITGFLTVTMWRKDIWTRIAAGGYLAFMLLATLPGGGHYVVDLIGGLLVWVAWFAWSLRIERRTIVAPGPTEP